MHIAKPIRTSKNDNIYRSILLRESYRKNGKVKNRTIANLRHCIPEEVAAIEFALNHKGDFAALPQTLPSLRLQQGFSGGAVYSPNVWELRTPWEPVGKENSCQKIPTPREDSQQLLQALQIKLPEVLPCRNVRVVTRKKLQDQRKSL
ncbi:MAG: hypothetical protein C4527_01460 [Candidatus Omnitrophota bacterium]|jgi:hypothetical protein|nr:MAG: hypothetical protein C4527_01460 [Candidatus Omnitrophota bacterium]